MLKFTDGAAAVIFDCDGTLADTMPSHIHAWCTAVSEHGLSVTVDTLKAHSGKPSFQFIRDIGMELGWTVDTMLLANRKEMIFKGYLNEVKPIEPVAAVAMQLAGRKPMAVASGGDRENVVTTLRSIGLMDLFQVIITGDDPVPPKPSPEIFIEAARLMGVAPRDCVVFEDADPGIIGAQAAGMRVVDVRLYLP